MREVRISATMVDAARALNAVVTISPKGVTIRARKESA